MAEPATSRKGIYRSRCTQNTQEFSRNAHIIQDFPREINPFFKEMQKKFCSTRFRVFRMDILLHFQRKCKENLLVCHAFILSFYEALLILPLSALRHSSMRYPMAHARNGLGQECSLRTSVPTMQVAQL